jgi:protein O-GlcNAc transferase
MPSGSSCQRLVMFPEQCQAILARAEQLTALGKWEEAESVIEAAIGTGLKEPDLLFALGRVRYQLGRATASDAFGQVCGLVPESAIAQFMLGSSLLREGRPADAIVPLRAAVALAPKLPKAALHLGIAHAQSQNWASAASAMKLALAADGAEHQARTVLEAAKGQLAAPAALLVKRGQQALATWPAEAEALFRLVLERDPAQLDAAWQLGVLMIGRGEWDRMIKLFEPLLDSPDVNLGMFLNVIAGYINLLNYEAGARVARSFLDRDLTLEVRGMGLARYVFIGAFDTGIGRIAMRAYAEEWTRWLRNDIAQPFTPEAKPRDGRRLRIGYLWSMFGYPIEIPFLAEHDRSRYALYAYSYGPRNVQTPDNVDRFDVYRWIEPLSEEAAARLIFKDEIDILVDLGGQGWQQRSKIAEYCPAPVQIAYSNKLFTTGSDRLDWLIGMPGFYPTDDAPYYRERLYTLPQFFVQACWQGEPPPPVPSYAGPTGGITLGSTTAIYKVNRATLDFWCAVLARLPEARLLLDFGPELPKTLQRIVDHFAAAGIPPDRYELLQRGSGSFFSYIDRLDLSLDAFPFTGNFTAYQAIARGVPLITIEGERYTSRLAAALLRAIDRPEWVARDAAEAVEIAVALASDPSRLAAERTLLPTLLDHSGALDAARYARAMEAAYEEIFADALQPAGAV